VHGQKPREIAVEVLLTRGGGGDFVENRLEAMLSAARLAPADRGLCQELVYGVVRWQATLDWLITRKTEGRWQKPGLLVLLRLGLYQMFWLDRVPDHAAVNETVTLAKERGFGQQAGFVNALLRGYARERDATRKLLDDLKVSQPHLGWSHPEWLVERWRSSWGAEKTAELLKWNNAAPATFARLNTLRTDATNLIERWREEDVEYDFRTWDWTGENLVFVLKSHPPLERLGSFRDGWFYVQDPSTLLAAGALAPQPGESILDLCAAPGGKTTYLAQLMENKGRIVAEDTSPERLRRLQENCRRLGVTCVETSLASANPRSAIRNPQSESASTRFDRVLLDAPCSNTGVLGRRVELRWRLRAEEIQKLQAIQLALLRQAESRLKLTGTLVYSTCSLEPEENEEVIRKFLAELPEFTIVSERQLLPFKDSVDGAYVAVLGRVLIAST
jgi:16S rRNA (cytosine967-C5)-methyltransferase